MAARGFIGRTVLLSAACLLAAGMSTAASASLSFNLAGSDSSSWGTVGNVRTVTATGGTAKVKVSGYTLTPTSNGNYTLQKSHLGSYSPGAGVSSSHTDAHYVENKSGVDFLLFQFDRNVIAESANFAAFTYNNTKDTDATIAVGGTSLPFSTNLVLTDWNQVFSMLAGGQFSKDASGNGGLRSINGLHQAGNVLIVAAGIFGDLKHIDAFKLKTLTVSEAPVPEPATWALMIGGFGLIGGTLRRRAGQANVRFA